MDSSDDNAVATEEGVRRTRSGRAVRPPPAAVPKQTARKTRKKMVLVEVEVSEEEEENLANVSINSEQDGEEMSNQPETENDIEDDDNNVLEEISSNNQIVEDSNTSDVQAVDFTPFQGDSSDQNDSRSAQFGSANDFTEQNSIQDQEVSSDQVIPENQDSLQTGTEENSVNDAINDKEDKENSTDNFDASVLNNDSQTQHKPEDKDEGNENSEPAGPASETEVMETEESIVEESKAECIVEESRKRLIEEKMDEDSSELEAKLNNDVEMNIEEQPESKEEEKKPRKQAIDPDTENISEDELPTMQAAKVPETEEVSDEELPGPKLAELPADTEVVSEDELPTVKKEGTKRKLEENEYDPGSPTSESESASKKPALDPNVDKKEEKPSKPRKLPELDKYWKAVNDDPTDFTGWTYLLQYVDQENDMEAAREAYDAFLSHYPYCYGYWRKYADYEKRKGNKKKCEEVFERGLKAIPLSVDLWIHFLNYTRTAHTDEEDHIRAQFERALTACGLEFRSDRLWDVYIKWETEAKRYQNVTGLYDRLLATPTQGYTNHFDNFQEHVAAHPPNKILEVDEFLALRKEIRHMLKHDISTTDTDSEAPPGETDNQDSAKHDEETGAIRERIVSIRRKIHKGTVNAVTARWNFEEGIKRPYFHVKPLERCQLKNWKEYLDYEIEQGDKARIIVLFERCLIACALYEEFWLRFVHYLESLNDPELKPKIRDVYERACTIHHLNKPSLHLQWAMFEECCENYTRAAEILVNLEKSVPNLLQVAYRRINLERRRGEHEKCAQLYEQYINNSKSKMISSNLSIKYARFCLKICKNQEKAFDVLTKAVEKDNSNSRLYLQLIDLQLQKEGISESEIIEYIDQFLNRESAEIEQKVLFAQRKLEFLEDFGADIQCVQKAYDDYQKFCKLNKEKKKKDDGKSTDTSGKKTKDPPLPATQTNSYSNYGSYAPTTTGTTGSSYSQYSSTPAAGQYSNQYGTQYSQNDPYQYQNWQYSQSGYGNYNQWGGYGNYY